MIVPVPLPFAVFAQWCLHAWHHMVTQLHHPLKLLLVLSYLSPGMHSEQILFTFAGSGQLCSGLQQRHALHEL